MICSSRPLGGIGGTCGCAPMGQRPIRYGSGVWRDKIMMVLHIRLLGKETLARNIYEEQKVKKWPGLAQESKVICAELEIEGLQLN